MIVTLFFNYWFATFLTIWTIILLYIAFHTLLSYTTYTSIEEMMDTCTRNNNFRAQMKLPSPRPWVRNDL